MSEQRLKSAPTLAELRARRDEILALAARYGASDVRVFGSVARGDATPASDVDLLVTFCEDASLYDLSGLRQALTELLDCPVDITEDHPNMKDRLRKCIMRDVTAL